MLGHPGVVETRLFRGHDGVESVPQHLTWPATRKLSGDQKDPDTHLTDNDRFPEARTVLSIG